MFRISINDKICTDEQGKLKINGHKSRCLTCNFNLFLLGMISSSPTVAGLLLKQYNILVLGVSDESLFPCCDDIYRMFGGDPTW